MLLKSWVRRFDHLELTCINTNISEEKTQLWETNMRGVRP